MVGCIGQVLKGLAGSLAGSLNPIQPATQRLRPMGGGLPNTKENGMNTFKPVLINCTKSTAYEKKDESKVYVTGNARTFITLLSGLTAEQQDEIFKKLIRLRNQREQD